MDFELTDDQLELQRVVRDIAERECTSELVRAAVDGSNDATDLWKTYVELDWPALTLPESAGGMGFSAVELVIVLEELGRVADPTGFLATASQYVPMVRECAGDDQHDALLTPVSTGATGAASFASADVQARQSGDGWILEGTARRVLDGDRADQVAVAATTDDGVGVFIVDGAAVQATRATTFDGSLHLADVTVDGADVPDDSALTGPDMAQRIARAREEAVAGLAATTVGASQRLFELVLAHIKERKQFGVAIGSFQAVKHMAVDIYVAIERARALSHFAGLTIAEDDPRRSLAVSMAKAAAGDAQRIAVQHGIQLYGGLGFTWENDLQIFMRRAKIGEMLLGSSAEHRALVARTVMADADQVEVA